MGEETSTTQAGDTGLSRRQSSGTALRRAFEQMAIGEL